MGKIYGDIKQEYVLSSWLSLYVVPEYIDTGRYRLNI